MTLSRADQIRVAKILVNPPEPTARFKRAAKHYVKMSSGQENASSHSEPSIRP
ncbi:hypothetical protein [Zymomonas mobilis]|uniref:hypothetical protein n=1 Tax=Zymomonas mobilis TaxID=542 RepID=UPI003EB8DCE6